MDAQVKIVYSGSAQLATTKSVVFMDPVKGPVKYASKTIHKFKLGQVNNYGSLISCIKVNPTTFLSINSFVGEITGHYAIIFRSSKDVIRHKLLSAKVIIIPSITFFRKGGK